MSKPYGGPPPGIRRQHIQRSPGLHLEPGEQTLVDSRPHPVHLVVPAAVLWVTVLVYSAARRLLDLTWNPVAAPWTTLHSFIGAALLAAALWVAISYVALPVWRWWRTRFVITDRRLALVGPYAPSGAVALPLEAVQGLRVAAPSGVHSLTNRWVDRATVIADFGRLGGLKLVGCPRPDMVADLIQDARVRHVARQGPQDDAPSPAGVWQDHYSGAGNPPQHRDEFSGGWRG